MQRPDVLHRGSFTPRVHHHHQSRRINNGITLKALKEDKIKNSPTNEPSSSPPPPTTSTTTTTTTTTTRRSILELTSIGALHAFAGRSIFSADAAFASPTSKAMSPATLARQLDDRVSEFTLPNGMHFIVSERRTVPVVSFHTYADVGAFDEVDGTTGVAHLLEHLAFKGTPRIGTTDFNKEYKLLDSMDEVFYTMLEKEGNEKATAALQSQLDALLAEAAALSVPNAYGTLLSREGAVGLNAATSHDATKYFCSMPANKIELWFALEAERFRAPVFREIYSEKKVVFEERRMRVDNSPLGPFQEEFAARSLSNNYRRPVIGYAQDLHRLGRKEVASFFAQHYGPKSMTISVVGDVRAAQVRQLAEKYFQGWESRGTPGEKQSVDDEVLPIPASSAATTTSSARGELSMRSRAGPATLRAYYRPSIRDADASTALDMVNDCFTGGRSARLYKNLVLDQQSALSVSSYSSFPAEKHPGQFVVYGIPAPGITNKQIDALVCQEIEKLADQGPTPTELRRYKKSARMGLVDVFQNNSGLAAALASYQVLTGGWKEICSDLERVDGLREEDVAAVASRYLTPENSFVGYVEI